MPAGRHHNKNRQISARYASRLRQMCAKPPPTLRSMYPRQYDAMSSRITVRTGAAWLQATLLARDLSPTDSRTGRAGSAAADCRACTAAARTGVESAPLCLDSSFRASCEGQSELTCEWTAIRSEITRQVRTEVNRRGCDKRCCCSRRRRPVIGRLHLVLAARPPKGVDQEENQGKRRKRQGQPQDLVSLGV